MKRWSRRSGWWVLAAVGAWSTLAGSLVQAGSDDPSVGPERSPVLLVGASRSTFGVGGDDAADPQPYWSPRLGLTYTAPRDAVFAFEFGLWADNRGGEWKDAGGALKGATAIEAPPAYTHRLRLLYLGVPLMVRYILPTPALTPYVKGGVVPSFLLNAREQTRATETDILVRGFHGVRDQGRVFQLDALAGVGLRTSIAQHAFIVETIYLHGLTDVLKDQSITPRGDLKNRSLQFFVGIGLRRERP